MLGLGIIGLLTASECLLGQPQLAWMSGVVEVAYLGYVVGREAKEARHGRGARLCRETLVRRARPPGGGSRRLFSACSPARSSYVLRSTSRETAIVAT